MIPRAMLAVAYATGRASHARQVKGDDPDKKGYTGPSGWGSGVRLTTPSRKKISLRNLNRRPRPIQGCRADDDNDDDDDDDVVRQNVGKCGRICNYWLGACMCGCVRVRVCVCVCGDE
jgi:hypothetical protein